MSFSTIQRKQAFENATGKKKEKMQTTRVSITTLATISDENPII